MQRKLRLGALVLLGVLLLSGFHQPTFAQARGRGRLIASYRAASGQAPPDWARQAIDRGRGQLLQRHAGAELAVVTADVDDLAMRHVRFDQRYHGLPVFGGQLIAQLNQAGDLQREFGHFYAGIALATQATLAPAQALARAEQALGYTGRFATPPTADLLILPAKTPASYTLAYHVTLKIEDGTPATAHHEYFVDAHSGAIVRHFDSLPHDAGTGHSLYSGDVPLNTERLSNGTYNLRDGSRGSMETRDAGNGDALFNDADNSWGTGTNADRQSAAADVQFGAAQTWDYYLNTYGRQGIDGSGYQVVSHVHYGTNYDNAFWDGSAMYYGDGDGATFAPLVALDVAGHEITHGLTEKTAGLIYQDESGAANESFSDIFGTAVEWYTGTVGGHAPDYWIGEDIYTPGTAGDALRYMDDPGKAGDPDHYTKRYTGSSDNGGVHTNSGIQNNAFYLLAEGGTNKTSNRSVTGIGRAKAEAIFFRALTVKLTPSATFMDVRNACLAAATDLYGAGSPEYTATRAAWAAVGVDANQAPTAIAGGPYTVAEGGSVVLTGSGSDPDGDPLVYAWDLDNNGTFETAGQNATFSAATLDGPSSATVRLQVCDDNLACDTTSATVTITNVAPQLSNLQVTPAATSEHALATLSGDIVDPGTQDTQTVVIRWGDGSTNTTVSLAAGATSFTTQHPYLDDNPTGTPSDSYAISVSVTDKDGASTTGSTSATVDNVAPTITSFAGTDSLAGALAFTPSTFNGTFTDPGTLDTHTAVLNWGTGEGSTSLALGPNVLALSTTHQFATPGCNKPVAVSVTDDDTGSATQGTTVNVGSGAFLAPMTNQPLTDKLKNGQVLPVKVRITDCSGNPVTNLTPAVRLMDGDQTPLADDGSDVLPIASVSAADTSGWMRLADGNYLYNMKVQVAKLNTDYTVIVYPYANQATGNLNGSLTLRHVIQATK